MKCSPVVRYTKVNSTFIKTTPMNWIAEYWWIIVIVIILLAGLKTINQGSVGVVTVFGKYRRVLLPGLRLIIPFIEQIYKRISIQNRSIEIEFQAVTADQANVYFKNMLLFAVQNAEETTIKKVAFKFMHERELMQALNPYNRRHRSFFCCHEAPGRNSCTSQRDR